MPRDKIMPKRKETNTLYFVMNTRIGKNTRCVKNILVTHKSKLFRLEKSLPFFLEKVVIDLCSFKVKNYLVTIISL